MRHLITSSAVLALTAGAATAGGLDRSNQNTGYLFGEANSTSAFIAHVMPSITGTDDAGFGNGDYDIGQSFNQIGASALMSLTPDLTFGFQYDQAFGGDVLYNGDPATAALAGTKADFASDSLNFMAKYSVNENISVFGGLRAQRAGGEVALGGLAYAVPAILQSDEFVATTRDALIAGLTPDIGVGLATGLVGAISDDAIRSAALGDNTDFTNTVAAVATPVLTAQIEAALTPVIGAAAAAAAAPAQAQAAVATAAAETSAAVQAGFNDVVRGGVYDVDVKDSWGVGYTLGAAYEIPSIALRAALTYHSSVKHTSDTSEVLAGSTPFNSEVDFETPQSVNFDFQTGIAEDTLLTFSYRWAEWGKFDIIPTALGSDLADLDDSRRYTIGLGRRLNDEWALSASISHEASGNSDNVSPLAATDGLTGINLGARYEADGMTFSGGIGYTEVGDADAGVGGVDVASFEGNSVTTIGFSFAYEF